MNSRRLFLLSTVVYLVSWFSPVHQEVSTGFEAYLKTVGGFYRLLWEPIEVSAILMAITPHTNYVVLGAALMMLPKKRDEATLRRLKFLLAFCAACDAVWLTEGSQLRFGYYLWLLSFALFALAAHLAIRESTASAK